MASVATPAAGGGGRVANGRPALGHQWRVSETTRGKNPSEPRRHWRSWCGRRPFAMRPPAPVDSAGAGLTRGPSPVHERHIVTSGPNGWPPSANGVTWSAVRSVVAPHVAHHGSRLTCAAAARRQASDEYHRRDHPARRVEVHEVTPASEAEQGHALTRSGQGGRRADAERRRATPARPTEARPCDAPMPRRGGPGTPPPLARVKPPATPRLRSPAAMLARLALRLDVEPDERGRVGGRRTLCATGRTRPAAPSACDAPGRKDAG